MEEVSHPLEIKGKKGENLLMRKRIEWIDMVKFICMFCVMINHLDCHSQNLYNFYYPFYLAGFFFCSGYCYKPLESFKDLIKKKAKQLLLPWFIYSNLNILISSAISIKDHEGFLQEVLKNLLQIRTYGDRLWFLVALFVTFIPFYFLVKYMEKDEKNMNKGILIGIIIFIIKKMYSDYVPYSIFPWGINKLPWHIDYIGTSLVSMIIGYCFKKKYESIFDKYNNLFNRTLLSIVYISIMLLAYSINVRFNFAFFVLYELIGQTLGILMVVAWSKAIKSSKYISFVGSNTLLYFCLHNKVETVLEYLVKKVDIIYSYSLSNEIASIVLSTIIVFITSIILVLPIDLINKYLPWTIGKERKNA